jgi:hypothetical protein
VNLSWRFRIPFLRSPFSYRVTFFGDNFVHSLLRGSVSSDNFYYCGNHYDNNLAKFDTRQVPLTEIDGLSLFADYCKTMAARKAGLAELVAKTEKLKAEQSKWEKKQAELQKKLDGDVHGLHTAQQQGKHEQESRKAAQEAREKREEKKALQVENTRKLEERALTLVEGMENMGLHKEFQSTELTNRARHIYAALRKTSNLSTMANMTEAAFIQRFVHGIRVSIYRARGDQKDTTMRIMRALAPEANVREGLTRVLVAENIRGGGLQPNMIFDKLRSLLPEGEASLNMIRAIGGPCETTRRELPTAAFAVELDAKLTARGDMFNFLRTLGSERVTELGGQDGTPIVETLWTVESGFDLSVTLIGEEAMMMARAFCFICSSLQFDKNTLDGILTECVRNSSEMKQWRDDVLWARLQMECFAPKRDTRGHNKITLHEYDWGASSGRTPKLLINVCSGAVYDAIVQKKPRVDIYLGVEYGDLVALSGTVTGIPRNDTMAGLAQAKERVGFRVEQALGLGEEILGDLKATGELAAEGRGQEAATGLYACRVRISTVTDAACFFLRDKIEELIQTARLHSSRLLDDEGRKLVRDVDEWREEFQVQRAALDKIMVQVKFFPKEPPAALAEGARAWWSKRTSLDRLRSRLQDLLQKELDTAKILCVEPIMNPQGLWHHTEGAILVVQGKEGLLQKCQLDKQGNRSSNKLSILSPGAAKGGASLRLVWMSELEPAVAGDDQVNVRDLLREFFTNAHGLWIPKQVTIEQSTVPVYLQGETNSPPPKLSSMGNSQGEYDIRNLHNLLGRTRDAVDEAAEVMGSLLEEGVVAPVHELDGMTLFIAKEFAIEFLATVQSQEEGGIGHCSFLLALKAGVGVRDAVLTQLGSTFLPLLVTQLPGGVWMRFSLEGGLQGTAHGDDEEMAQGSGAGRWWEEVVKPHVLTTMQRNDLAETIVSAALGPVFGIQAIRKRGAVLLIQTGSFWLEQLRAASELIPGNCIPTDTLPISEVDRNRFEEALWPRAAALGAKWTSCDDGTEGVDRTKDLTNVVKALEEDIDGGLKREIWLNLPPINCSTLIQVAGITAQPVLQGTGIVFVPYSGDMGELGKDALLQCKAEAKGDERPTTRIFTTAQLLPEWDVATFGKGATRMLQMMVNEGRATVLKASGGFVVVMAERVVRRGGEISLQMVHAFQDTSLATVVKGIPTQASALRTIVETASLSECKRKLTLFFASGRVGVLAGTQFGDDGLLQQTKQDVVIESICLRDQIRHPAMYDSRGLRVIEEVQTSMGVRAVAVGLEKQHLLLGSILEGGLMPRWDEHDPRFSAWDPAVQEWDSLFQVADRSLEKRSSDTTVSNTDKSKRSRSSQPPAATGGQGSHHQHGEHMEDENL